MSLFDDEELDLEVAQNDRLLPGPQSPHVAPPLNSTELHSTPGQDGGTPFARGGSRGSISDYLTYGRTRNGVASCTFRDVTPHAGPEFIGPRMFSLDAKRTTGHLKNLNVTSPTSALAQPQTQLRPQQTLRLPSPPLQREPYQPYQHDLHSGVTQPANKATLDGDQPHVFPSGADRMPFDNQDVEYGQPPITHGTSGSLNPHSEEMETSKRNHEAPNNAHERLRKRRKTEKRVELLQDGAGADLPGSSSHPAQREAVFQDPAQRPHTSTRQELYLSAAQALASFAQSPGSPPRRTMAAAVPVIPPAQPAVATPAHTPTPPGKMRMKNGKIRTTKWREDLTSAIREKARLPPCEIGAAELVVFFPNHTLWPKVILRLIGNGWSMEEIGRGQLHARNTGSDESSKRRHETLRQQKLTGAKLEYGLHDFTEKRYPKRIVAITSYDASSYVPRPADAHSLFTAKLVDIARGVVNMPAPADSGIVTQAIQYAVASNQTNLTTEDIPRVAQAQGFVMPAGAAGARWDQQARVRALNAINAAGTYA